MENAKEFIINFKAALIVIFIILLVLFVPFAIGYNKGHSDNNDDWEKYFISLKDNEIRIKDWKRINNKFDFDIEYGASRPLSEKEIDALNNRTREIWFEDYSRMELCDWK